MIVIIPSIVPHILILTFKKKYNNRHAVIVNRAVTEPEKRKISIPVNISTHFTVLL